jgi:hypothetical protein
LETSGDEHDQAAKQDTNTTTESIDDWGSEGNGSEGTNVLDGIVQGECGAFRFTKIPNPGRDCLKTVWSPIVNIDRDE